MNLESPIFVAGHRGLVGSAIVRALQKLGYANLILADRSELDLTNQADVRHFFRENQIDYVFVAAARVGGIHANATYPAEFLYENLMIAANILYSAHQHKVKKLLYLGSNCIYPKLTSQPMKEDSLLSGPLEPTNEAYAISKIAGLKLCYFYRKQFGCNFIAAMPTSLYGIGDNFHPLNSHVLAGLLRRFHEAKCQKAPEVVVWGTGNASRELLYSDDLAEALLVLMEKYDLDEIINLGSGQEVTISELAQLLKEVTGFSGNIRFDSSKPDGTPRKVLELSKMEKLNWCATTPLRRGVKQVYEWAIDNGVFDSQSVNSPLPSRSLFESQRPVAE